MKVRPAVEYDVFYYDDSDHEALKRLARWLDSLGLKIKFDLPSRTAFIYHWDTDEYPHNGIRFNFSGPRYVLVSTTNPIDFRASISLDGYEVC